MGRRERALLPRAHGGLALVRPSSATTRRCSTGSRRGIGCAYDLEIDIDDVERFSPTPSTPPRARGRVVCDDLGGELQVEQGWFNLFVDAGGPRHRRMLYRLLLRDPRGTPLTLSGFKDVEDGPHLDGWSDTLAAARARSSRATVTRSRIGERAHGRHRDPAHHRGGLARMLSADAPLGRLVARPVRALARFDEFFIARARRGLRRASPHRGQRPVASQPTDLDHAVAGSPPGRVARPGRAPGPAAAA